MCVQQRSIIHSFLCFLDEIKQHKLSIWFSFSFQTLWSASFSVSGVHSVADSVLPTIKMMLININSDIFYEVLFEKSYLEIDFCVLILTTECWALYLIKVGLFQLRILIFHFVLIGLYNQFLLVNIKTHSGDTDFHSWINLPNSSSLYIIWWWLDN